MKRLVAVALVGAVLAAGCSVQGDNADAPTPTVVAGEDPTTTTVPGAAEIDWEDCGSGFECGTLDVPLDYDDPEGRTFELAVTRHRADEPSERVGVLIVNPGGPGGSAVDLARSLPRAGDLGDKFDIVGFDPRGVGGSTPLDCHSHLQEMYDADPTIDGPLDRVAILETSSAFVDECEAGYADLLPFLGTTDVARDMDEVRKALGEEQVNYLGYSYGTSLGQEYARLFPTRVRSMILDGVVDHEPDGVTTAETQAQGFTTAFENYAQHCEDEGCGYDAAAGDMIDLVTARAEDAPIPAPSADRPATPGVVSLALARALYSEQLWGSLSRALRDAADGDGSGLVSLADDYLGRDPSGTYDGGFEIYFAVSCLDETWPDTPEELIADAKQAGVDNPRFGEQIVIDYVRCPLWPVEAKPLAPVPADIEGLPPVLVVSTTGDPATPYENGVAVADQIPGAVLLTNEGEGHTIVALGKPCIDDIAIAYLVDLDLPADGTTCS